MFGQDRVKNGDAKSLQAGIYMARSADEESNSARACDGAEKDSAAGENDLKVAYEGKIELKKTITFTGVLAILLGNIGGASIFIAPTTILVLSGSPGLAVVLWCAGGLLTWSIAYSVCELALLLPGAGGPYIYTLKVFGNIPGFILLWGFILLIGFPSWALSSYTGALYILSVFYPTCRPPDYVVKLIAAWLLVTLVAVNCTYTQHVTKLQKFFSGGKAAAMITIIIAAFTTISSESSRNNISQFMDNTNADVGRICLSLFASYFAYGGWQIITVLMEEVHNPVKVVPKALGISFTISIFLFVATNVGYYMVLTPHEAIQSDAIAMTFGWRVHQSLPIILAIMVTLCCIGSINIVVMGQPRMLYAAARRGHMPRMFALLHHKFLTPWPATFVMLLGSLYMLLSGTVSSLINYISLYVCIMLLTLLLAIIVLRFQQPHKERPIKVPLAVLIGQTVLTLALIVVSVFEKPQELGVCLLLLILAVPVYVIFVKAPKPKAFNHLVDKFTNFIQIMLQLELPSTYKHER